MQIFYKQQSQIIQNMTKIVHETQHRNKSKTWLDSYGKDYITSEALKAIELGFNVKPSWVGCRIVRVLGWSLRILR